MINGHGDDSFMYQNIRMNFSSNICQHADHSALKKHLMERFDLISNYPEPEAWTLEQTLAKKYDVAADCVLVTSGATEAIYLIAHAYSHLPYFVCQPTFSEYEDACRMFGMPKEKGGLTWVCNPRNPDGYVYSQQEIYQLANTCQLLVIDQAYECYTRCHQRFPILHSPSTITLHSMTKTYAVPGLRLGYIIAESAIINHLRRYLHPWSVNALAIEAGLFLLEHEELIAHPNLEEAQLLYRCINQIDGFSALPTETNFMLCRTEYHTAADLKDYLAREHGMLIRDASNFHGLNNHFFRVAAQLPEENNALVEALRKK